LPSIPGPKASARDTTGLPLAKQGLNRALRLLTDCIKIKEDSADLYKKLEDDSEALRSLRASFFQKGGVM
jgi:hypothetical protein